MTEPSESSRRNHPVADAIGACFRGWREGDHRTRQNVKSWVKLLMGGGLGVYIAVIAVSDWRSQARNVRADGNRQAANLVNALERNTDKIGDLIEVITAAEVRKRQVDAVILERLRISPPKPLTPAQKREVEKAGEKPSNTGIPGWP